MCKYDFILKNGFVVDYKNAFAKYSDIAIKDGKIAEIALEISSQTAHALIRTAGGREVNLRDMQVMALSGGLNGIMIGGYLTTGGRNPEADKTMLRDLGRKTTQPQL